MSATAPPPTGSAMLPSDPPLGRIITFYSYKGGTGRSMALANVAWILASKGARVLAIDWDLEAPGLHRYFAPFIEDKELENSPGLIDLMGSFVAGAGQSVGDVSEDWYKPYATIGCHAFSLDWEFPERGTLDFMPAGRQSAAYGTLVTTFNWADFYERLGGGLFLEALKQNLRSEYDYVLIDSRTGLSDTSGICTVHMPDELVICFTLNKQSILGAAAAAGSAFEQRMTPKREPGIRIWPVPTRVENSERERVEQGRDGVRERFKRFIYHIPAAQRNAYWGSVEVPYQPYFAFEEVLAVLADRKFQTGSLLGSFESLAACLTDRRITELGEMNEEKRQRALASYASSNIGPFYLSYSNADSEFASALVEGLRERLGQQCVLWDKDLLKPGVNWADTLATAINEAQLVLILLSKNYVNSTVAQREAEYAMGVGLRVLPLLMPDISFSELSSRPRPYPELMRVHAFAFESGSVRTVDELVENLRSFPANDPRRMARTNPLESRLARFGTQSLRDDYLLSASIEALSADVFAVTLTVSRFDQGPFAGEVEFHLPSGFTPSVQRVAVKDNSAELRLEAWGAFRIGAIVLDGYTKLVLDLANISSAPELFRLR